MRKRAYGVQLVAGMLMLTAGGSIGVASARHRNSDSTTTTTSGAHGKEHRFGQTTTTTAAPKPTVATTTTVAPTTTTTTIKPVVTTLPPPPPTTTTQPATTTVPPPPPAPSGSCSQAISAGASISAAVTAAGPGDVVCLHGGVYSQVVTLSDSGTAGSPITVTSYPGETAILDGSGAALSSTGSIVNITGSYVHLANVEVRNSSGRGITVTGTGSAVTNSRLHDLKYNAVIAAGANEVFDGNEVWNTVMSNLNAAKGSSGWAEAMNTYHATNTTFRNNNIHDNWGEGIDFIASTGGVVTGNTIVDNFSVLVYVDGSSSISITNNHLATTKSTFYRGSNPPVGVLMADESGSRGVANITITSNVLTHTGGISSWNVVPTLLTVVGNTIS
jgi:parallel beta-helix repeat protein